MQLVEQHIIDRKDPRFATIDKDGHIICADMNGAYNILRKSRPDAFADAAAKGVAGYVVHPVRLAV